MSQQGSSQAQDLNKRIIERIATDPQFRQQMANNPEQAIANSEFGQEAHQLASQQTPGPLQPHGGGPSNCIWTCTWTVSPKIN